MQPGSSLRLGGVKFLNARPLISGWPGEILLENPSVLCRKLAAGELDVALVSSFEFLRNPVYRIVDRVSISSDGPVYSVVLAHCAELDRIEEVELDPASETSVNLLRLLLAERGLKPRFIPPTGSAAPDRARLLIGDHAIRFRRDHPDFRFLDLGQEWKASADLPFVYALWLVRPEVTQAREVAGQLRALRDENLENLDSLCSSAGEFDREFCAKYYRQNLRFEFGEREKQGLRLFHELCVKHSLLPRGAINFRVV